MKLLFVTVLLSSSVFSATGEFVCKRACALNDPTNGYCKDASTQPKDVSRTLNEMNCDTSKPVNVAPEIRTDTTLNRTDVKTDYYMVCCVER